MESKTKFSATPKFGNPRPVVLRSNHYPLTLQKTVMNEYHIRFIK